MTALAPQQLRRCCDPGQFGFESTAELPDLDLALGQARALEAVRFGIAIRRDGYNVFALGPTGVGKHTVVLRILRERAALEPTPPDWCYVHNFAEPQRPRALRLPPGRAAPLARDMTRLVGELRAVLPAAFQSEDYRSRKKLFEEQLRERQEKAFEELGKSAAKRGIALLRTPLGLALAPLRNGEVIEPEEFRRLPLADQERHKAALAELQEQLQTLLAGLPRWEREQREKLRELDREVTAFAVGHLMDELRARWADVPEVLAQLEAVQQDVLDNAEEFLPGPAEPDLAALLVSRRAPQEARDSRRYEVNVLVDHGGSKGALVVYEDHPTHANLLGRVEHQSQLGALVTDFHLVKAGALHRANGGYLVLDARKLLQQPFAWEELKRALRSRQVRIESLGQALGLVSTVSLEPEPVPLDVKVVLVGERFLYYLLAQLDPDFPDLFKVAADFDDEVERTPEGEALYARLLGTLARRDGLRPLDPTAVARVVEHGARLAADAERLSTRIDSLFDLLREADHCASAAGKTVVGAAEVQQAIDAQLRRADRLRERVQEDIRRGTILVDTQGEEVGQVNGLSVIQLGEVAFGRPSRITARVRLGSGQVVDIEREVALGGPIHSKGVLILAGFLGARYSAERPLSLSASLVFEQSYAGVEGDSASSAELFALLSALAEVPVKQRFACTGSVDQQGQIQAIGGVNEKIEGFFDVCKAKGMTGAEGVLIPASNVKNLMLRSDVVAAVAAGRFQVHAVETVDEGIAILTGIPAGQRDELGNFPEGSLNRRVEARLAAFAEKARAWGKAVKPEPAP